MEYVVSNPLADREIVIAVGGGIAAYKVAALASGLVQRSAHVSVVMTDNSRNFIGEATFAALTGRPVATRSFDPAKFPLGAHIELAERAELIVVAPSSKTLHEIFSIIEISISVEDKIKLLSLASIKMLAKIGSEFFLSTIPCR